MQASDLAGVGTQAMRAIFKDIEANGERQAEAVIASLPGSFPDQLVTSAIGAIKDRTRLVADSLSAASHV